MNVLPNIMMFKAYPKRLLSALIITALTTAAATAGELHVRPLPRAASSSISGINFADAPRQLPIDTRFSEAIQTVAFDLDLTCRQIEAYGWTMKQNEQDRVDGIFTNAATDLAAQGYIVKPQNPASAAEDITVYTATRANNAQDHLLMMWSAGEAGLLLLMCDAKGSGEQVQMSSANDAPSFPDATPYVDANPTKLIGEWMGRYTCRTQGQTGATLTVTHAKVGSSHDNHAIEGVFSFYPTPDNPGVASGSYRVSGTYDETTQQAFFTPTQWLQRPEGYGYNPFVVYFDVQRQRLSAIFQDTTGCTSFEAGLKEGSAAAATSMGKETTKKKAPARKKAAPKKVVAKPKVEEAPLVDDTISVGAETVPETSGDSVNAIHEGPTVSNPAPTTATISDVPAAAAAKQQPAAVAPAPSVAPAAAVPAPKPTAVAPTAAPAAPAVNVPSVAVPATVAPAAAPATIAPVATPPTTVAPKPLAVPTATAPAAVAPAAAPVAAPTGPLVVPPSANSGVIDIAPKADVATPASPTVDNTLGGLAIPPAKAPAAQ